VFFWMFRCGSTTLLGSVGACHPFCSPGRQDTNEKMASVTHLDHFAPPLIPLPVPLLSGKSNGQHNGRGMDTMTTIPTTRMVSYSSSSRTTTPEPRYLLSLSSLPLFWYSSDEYDGDDDDDDDDDDDVDDDQLTKDSPTSVDSSDRVVRMAADSFLDNNNNKLVKDVFTFKPLLSFAKKVKQKNMASHYDSSEEEEDDDEWSFATDPHATFESFDDASELTYCDGSCDNSSVGDSSISTKLMWSNDNKNHNSDRYFSASVSYYEKEEEEDDDEVRRSSSTTTTTVITSQERPPEAQPFLEDRRIMDFLNELCDKSSSVSTDTTPTPSTITTTLRGLSVSTSCKGSVGQETVALRV
jgi:hypothetical protein